MNKTQELAEKWIHLAMDMINELRQDYIPGELGELDGVKAIRKLRNSKNYLVKVNFIYLSYDTYLVRASSSEDAEQQVYNLLKYNKKSFEIIEILVIDSNVPHCISSEIEY